MYEFVISQNLAYTCEKLYKILSIFIWRSTLDQMLAQQFYLYLCKYCY